MDDLPEHYYNCILNDEVIEDNHMDYFIRMLMQLYPNTIMYQTWEIQSNRITELPSDKKSIQILFNKPLSSDGIGHWICTYYDTQNLYIYDSLNLKKLLEDHSRILKILHPYCFNQNTIQFPKVQQQTNSIDCGVFSIAFATSIVLGIKPERVMYITSLMRLHLLNILVNFNLYHFPCQFKIVPFSWIPSSFKWSRSNIIENDCLTDNDINFFLKLLEKSSFYQPVDTLLLNKLRRIPENPIDRKHLQILYNRPLVGKVGHWICCYYDTENLTIYDSLNSKRLKRDHRIFLEKLHPHYFINKKTIYYPDVKSQSNGADCGVFAIAFATTVLFGSDPSMINYDTSKLRQHLLNIFENRIIEEFPILHNNNDQNSISNKTTTNSTNSSKTCNTVNSKSGSVQNTKNIKQIFATDSNSNGDKISSNVEAHKRNNNNNIEKLPKKKIKLSPKKKRAKKSRYTRKKKVSNYNKEYYSENKEKVYGKIKKSRQTIKKSLKRKLCSIDTTSPKKMKIINKIFRNRSVKINKKEKNVLTNSLTIFNNSLITENNQSFHEMNIKEKQNLNCKKTIFKAKNVKKNIVKLP